MKFLVFLLAVLTTSAVADFIEIDWSNVKPIKEYERFWTNKPLSLRPPANYFTRSRDRRIVNGNEATPHQFPYQAALLFFIPSLGGSALCGGALIDARFVLTAAHCVDGATEGTVILGAHFFRNIESTQHRISMQSDGIIMHPAWNPSLIQNDIALLHLPISANLHPVHIRTIIVPRETDGDFSAVSATVSGWGRYSDDSNNASDVLRFYHGTTLTQQQCNLRFPGVIQPSNICLSGVNNGGACQGDSGGPLTTIRPADGAHIHIGVVSFGLALGCELTWPSVFARTTHFAPWIRSHVAV